MTPQEELAANAGLAKLGNFAMKAALLAAMTVVLIGMWTIVGILKIASKLKAPTKWEQI